MSVSNIKVKSSEIMVDDMKINHNFGEGYTLKIIQIAPDSTEKVMLEIETTTDRIVNLKATITDREIV